MHMMELILTEKCGEYFCLPRTMAPLVGLIRHRHTCHTHGELFGAQRRGRRPPLWRGRRRSVVGSSDNDTLYGGWGSDTLEGATAKTLRLECRQRRQGLIVDFALAETTSGWAISLGASMAARRSSTTSSGSYRTVAGWPVCSRLMPMVRPAAAGAPSLWPKERPTFMPFRSTRSAICSSMAGHPRCH